MAEPVEKTSRNLSLDNLIDLINVTRIDLAKLQESAILSAEEKNGLFTLALQIKETFYKIADLCIPK